MILLLLFAQLIFQSSAEGKLPPIGLIEFFGYQKLTEKQLRDALPLKEGDPFPESMDQAIKRLH